MRLPRFRVAALAAAAAALAAGAAGCAAAASAAARTSAAATATVTATRSTAPPGNPSAAAGTRPAQARAEAARLVSLFVPPAGARAVAPSPVPSSQLSTSPVASAPLDDDNVRQTAWWLAPGDPRQLLAWEVSHLTRYQPSGSGTAGPGIYTEMYIFSAADGVFDYRELTVSATAAGPGQSAIRVDSAVDWIPARAAGDTVPASARMAVLSLTTGPTGTAPRLTPVHSATLTARAQVARLAAYLNGLPVDSPGGAYSCPAAIVGAGAITVTFLARPGGPALARATASLTGCGLLSYTMPAQPPTGLGGGDAGTSLLSAVNQVAGLHWKTP